MTAISMPAPGGIPLLGLGTYPLTGEEAFRTVRMAIDLGIRHIDTAQMYGNEREIGRAVASSGLPRGDFFMVTKVDPGNLGAARFADSVARSVDDLGGPADLLLIHWPPPEDDFDATLDRLMAERAKGNTKAIGVSNFSPAMMRRAQQRCAGALINNQVEFHPLLDQQAVLATAREQGMVLSAYSPLARGAAMKPAVIAAIAARLGRPPSEVVLRWIMQQGVVAIPMTTKRENALSNIAALSLELSPEDMAAITGLGTRHGRTINPSWMAGRWEP
ncbi:MAG: aldo/keto reductase [Aestuariivirga sp.]|uniref:aldo/keto reductase n=1 Tax=Aestuariivirga sp. TaxID=2650926 RepID=UPI0038D19A5D